MQVMSHNEEDLISLARGLHDRAQRLLKFTEHCLVHGLWLGNAFNSTRGKPTLKTSQKHHGKVDGLVKFRTTLKAELKYLKRLLNDPKSIKPSHVLCSNVPGFESVFALAQDSVGVQAVYKTVTFHHRNPKSKLAAAKERIRVDIVCESGLKWIKVMQRDLRNMKHELMEAVGLVDDEDDEEDSIPEDSQEESPRVTSPEDVPTDTNETAELLKLPLFRSAINMIEAAKQTTPKSRFPKIVFKFVSNTRDECDPRIPSLLEQLGVTVEFGEDSIWKSRVLDTYEMMMSDDGDMQPTEDTPIPVDTSLAHTFTDTINVDVTTLLALISELCHNIDNIPPQALTVSALQSQRSEEEISPLLPHLLPLFRDKQSVCTHSAALKFWSIVSVIAGTHEKARAVRLFGEDVAREYGFDMSLLKDVHPVIKHDLPLVRIIPDNVSNRFKTLPTQSKSSSSTTTRMTSHHIQIFGTSDTHHYLTVTSNSWLPSMLPKHDIHLSFVVHQPRSLVEQRVERVRRGENPDTGGARKRRDEEKMKGVKLINGTECDSYLFKVQPGGGAMERNQKNERTVVTSDHCAEEGGEGEDNDKDGVGELHNGLALWSI